MTKILSKYIVLLSKNTKIYFHYFPQKPSLGLLLAKQKARDHGESASFLNFLLYLGWCFFINCISSRANRHLIENENAVIKFKFAIFYTSFNMQIKNIF